MWVEVSEEPLSVEEFVKAAEEAETIVVVESVAGFEQALAEQVLVAPEVFLPARSVK